ncbi:MAG: response regulator [bacterium]|nr:response regulator [bacterium]
MDDPIRVLLVDDEPKLLAVWQRFLNRSPGVECVGSMHCCTNLAEQALETDAQVILMDLSIPETDPFEVISELQDANIPARVLVYSGRSDRGLREELERRGAWGFADKLEAPPAVVDRIVRIANGEKAF